MTFVTEFGPGHDSTNPMKLVPIPMNPITIQRIRCLITVLAGRTTYIIATGRLLKNVAATIL
jgi:hypothetical protein